MNQIQILTTIALVIFGELALWLAVLFLASRISGWHALGKRFRCRQPFEGKRWYLQHLQLRWRLNYGGSTIGASAEGLYINAWATLGIGHPKLFIPWSETKIEVKRTWYGEWMEIGFPNVPGTLIRIYPRLVRRIAAFVGPQLARSEEPYANAV